MPCERKTFSKKQVHVIQLTFMCSVLGPKELIDDLSKKNYLDLLEHLKNYENNIEYHHAIASLLKKYLQSMSAPLLSPSSLYF